MNSVGGPGREIQPWRVGPTRSARSVSVAEPALPSVALLRRRELLRRGGLVGLGAVLAGSLALLADYCNPTAPPARFGDRIAIPARKLPKPGAAPLYNAPGRFWLVNLVPGAGGTPPDYAFTAVTAAGSRQGGLLALYQKCPHLGCTVLWRPDFPFGGVRGWFRCPCCGSTFTEGGVRVFGPSPRSLDTFPIAVHVGLGVHVNTGNPIAGDSADPQRSTKLSGK